MGETVLAPPQKAHNLFRFLWVTRVLQDSCEIGFIYNPVSGTKKNNHQQEWEECTLSEFFESSINSFSDKSIYFFCVLFETLCTFLGYGVI